MIDMGNVVGRKRWGMDLFIQTDKGVRTVRDKKARNGRALREQKI